MTFKEYFEILKVEFKHKIENVIWHSSYYNSSEKGNLYINNQSDEFLVKFSLILF